MSTQEANGTVLGGDLGASNLAVASTGTVWMGGVNTNSGVVICRRGVECGIDVKQVEHENTARRCSTCGFTHPENRESESFTCQKRGYENHADYNAARNIGLRYLRRNQTGGDEGTPLCVCLNSRTLNANGAYEPPAEGSDRMEVYRRFKASASGRDLEGEADMKVY